jgi:hypothetical protein
MLGGLGVRGSVVVEYGEGFVAVNSFTRSIRF